LKEKLKLETLPVSTFSSESQKTKVGKLRLRRARTRRRRNDLSSAAVNILLKSVPDRIGERAASRRAPYFHQRGAPLFRGKGDLRHEARKSQIQNALRKKDSHIWRSNSPLEPTPGRSSARR
jgi:hypothetical protein